MGSKTIFSMLKQSVSDFSEDDALTLAAALAFYTALALAPLLVLLLTVTSLLGESTQARVVNQMKEIVGPQASQGLSLVMENARQQQNLATMAGVLSVIALAFSATGAFVQLQTSLNRIWDVQAKSGSSYWQWIRKRLLSFGLIIAIGVVLLASVVVSAALGMVLQQTGWIWQLANFLISMGVLILLFAIIFNYLPDVEISWADVWTGAALTAILFAVGKYLTGLYFSYSSVGSSYGAAGSLVILLVWVYYSATIVFLGAELTQVYARHSGKGIQPSPHAEWVPDSKPAKHARQRDAA